MKFIATTTAIALMGAAFAAAPAAANNQPDHSAIGKADKAARATIRAVYGGAGYRFCGARCAEPAARAGEGIYSKTQDISRKGAAKIQAVGARLRKPR